jgi:hypothetical protein
MMPFLAFDMEIAKPVPDGADLLAHRPGIACAALAREGEPQALVMFNPDEMPDLFDPATKTMTQAGATRVLLALDAAVGRGDTLVTWNGAGFDFRLLADETGRHADCVRLALKSVDMMFQVLCDRGHPLSLDSALKGAGLPAKVDQVTLGNGHVVQINGADAPRYWQEGEYAAVMAYCAADAERTLALAAACQRSRRLSWISQKGRPNEMYLRTGWLTVEQCLALPLPDTSWMTRPMSRGDVLAWTKSARRISQPGTAE